MAVSSTAVQELEKAVPHPNESVDVLFASLNCFQLAYPKAKSTDMSRVLISQFLKSVKPEISSLGSEGNWWVWQRQV